MSVYDRWIIVKKDKFGIVRKCSICGYVTKVPKGHRNVEKSGMMAKGEMVRHLRNYHGKGV